jgi:hypothetical protein
MKLDDRAKPALVRCAAKPTPPSERWFANVTAPSGRDG